MIFIDTWAWLATANDRDAYYQVASAELERLVRARETFVTSDHILSETITNLYRIIGSAAAQRYVDSAFRWFDTGACRLVSITPSRFSAAWLLRKKFADKPDISFTDLTSMVVMAELGITDVFTGDAHFSHVGVGFRLLPETP